MSASAAANMATAAPPATPPHGLVSLYVGDLDTEVTDGQLFDLFSQVSEQVVSVKICREMTGRWSLGYGYVNFNNAHDAARAMHALNYTPLNGKPIRVMYSNRDPYIRKSGHANIFIKNLDSSIDNKSLSDVFVSFGTILSSKVVVDRNGQSKGYGFVQFDNEESAKSATEALNGKLINEKQVYVGPFVPRQERNRTNGVPKFTNVYVKNLLEATSDEDLNKLFEPYGTITSAVVAKDANGKSRCFGFINFQSPDSAAEAVEKLNGTTISGDKVLFVGRAQKKAEREAELRAKFEEKRLRRYEKLKGANLYLKNLDDDINDGKLKELFSSFGTITSCKVMLDPRGISKGYGFIAFSTPDEAARAINEMNGKMIGRKPLYVAVAQRKEERKSQLQQRFAQMRATGGIPHLAAGIPAFPPGASRLAPQQLYYGQGPHGMIPSQPAGYGFQQQLVPGMRPGVPPNFIMPYHLQMQGQAVQRMGNRRGGNNHQAVNRNFNQGSRYVARNGIGPSAVPQGLVSPVPMPMPFEASGVPMTPIDNQQKGPVNMSTLASSLASATPENQRMMLGEQLFPLVEHLETEHAAKVTGMLLEMDQTEVLHLIESPDALKEKVTEAMDVLRSVASGSGVSHQLGSLAVNE